MGREDGVSPRTSFHQVGQANPKIYEGWELLGKKRTGSETSFRKDIPELVPGAGVVGSPTGRLIPHGGPAEYDFHPAGKHIFKNHGDLEMPGLSGMPPDARSCTPRQQMPRSLFRRRRTCILGLQRDLARLRRVFLPQVPVHLRAAPRVLQQTDLIFLVADNHDGVRILPG